MSDRDDGGPVSPLPAEYKTLRDWFAGQALAGIMTGANKLTELDIAVDTYGIADAMLAERAKDMPTGAAEFDPARLGETGAGAGAG